MENMKTLRLRILHDERFGEFILFSFKRVILVNEIENISPYVNSHNL